MSLTATRLKDILRPEPGSYAAMSRTNTYGLLFALPLLMLYEVAVAAINIGEEFRVRNGADQWLRSILRSIGIESTVALSALLVAAGLLIVLRERRGNSVPIRPKIFGAMLVESAILAGLFGTVVGRLTSSVLSPFAAGPSEPLTTLMSAAPQAVATLGVIQQLVLSLGAGLYEELVFRVLLIPALIALFVATRRIERPAATAIAVIVSSLIFSAAHYVGPLGDTLALGSFTLRFIGGLAFSLILVLRGFGIVAWTHALYDVFLILFGM